MEVLVREFQDVRRETPEARGTFHVEPSYGSLFHVERSAVSQNTVSGLSVTVYIARSVCTFIPARRLGMALVVAIANQKGGVGKTTTAINLGTSLAVAEQRTLIVDIDPQGNATSGLGVEKRGSLPTVYDVLVDDRSVAECLRNHVHFPFLSLVPSNRDLIGAEIELVNRPERERVLSRALGSVRNDYDFILVDCPPSLGLLTLNTLVAADSVLIPIQCEFYALEGLSQLLNTIRLVQRGLNRDLEIEGVLLTMYDRRLNLSKQVAEEAREYFGAKVFETTIPRNVRLAEAPGFGQPIITYDVLSAGAQSYLALAREMLQVRGRQLKKTVTKGVST